MKLIDRKFAEKISPLLKALSVSTTNQIVTSGTNFLLTIFLIRALSINEFGLYGILQSASFVLAGLGNSLFLSQMVVHYPDKEINVRDEYVSTILFLIAIASSLILLLGFIIIFFAKIGEVDNYLLFINYYSALVFSVSYLLKEFYCRLAYTHRVESRALRINIVIAINLLLSITLMNFIYVQLTASNVFYCYAISSVIGAVIGQLEVRLPLRLDFSKIGNSFKEVWVGGKWAVTSDILNSCRQQAHIFITATIAGTTGVATINSAKIFLMPVMLITPSFSQLYIVRLVALRQFEPLKLLRSGILFSVANAACVLVYGLTLFFVFRHIAPLVLSNKFPGIEPFVVAWFFVSFFSAARYGLESTQKALKRFKSLLIVNVPVSIFALLSVYFLLVKVGPVGSIFGLALAELFLALVLVGIVLLSAKELQLSTVKK